MTLRERLDALRNQRSAIPELHEPYEAMMAELRRTDFLEHALRAGDRFPDFMLPNAEGRLITLEDLLAEGPLVLTFFRGDWCPYCRVVLDALEEMQRPITEQGATLAAVTPDSGGRALEAKKQHGAHYEILSDLDNGVGLQCGVVFRLPDHYRRLLERYDIDLGKRHGNGGWFLPVPATYILDRDKVIRWEFLDLDFTRRAEPSTILESLTKLRRDS
ncbi:MAG: AhpC/TSA family protein [Acetobacteraceae bacterium]|nr:AhpC/TSA family protein [Acetobacteraceae bacterium]